ncbi:YceO family protein [Enterobacter sp. JGM127]|nr:YceO family protein [Enterobacter sp. JGM127]
MRRLLNYLINNIREHLMLYIVLWSLLAVIDVAYILFYAA